MEYRTYMEYGIPDAMPARGCDIPRSYIIIILVYVHNTSIRT